MGVRLSDSRGKSGSVVRHAIALRAVAGRRTVSIERDSIRESHRVDSTRFLISVLGNFCPFGGKKSRTVARFGLGLEAEKS